MPVASLNMKAFAGSLLFCLVVAIPWLDTSAVADTWNNQNPVMKAQLDRVVALGGNKRVSRDSPHNETGYAPLNDDFPQVYQTINNHLVDQVQEDDPESNMLRANSWLNAVLSRNGSEFVKSHPDHVDEKLVEALRNFTALGNVGDSCNRTVFEIVKAFDNGTQSRSRKRSCHCLIKTVMRRIDKVGNHYITRYAKNCRSSFATSATKKYAELDADIREQVKNLTDAIMREQFFYNPDAARSSYMVFDYIKTKGSMYSDQFIRDTIASLAREDPDSIYLNGTIDEREGKVVVNEEKVKELYERYLTTPCKHFVAQLEDVLEPAEFLLNWYREADGKSLEFYLIWYRYSQCKHHVIDRQSYMEKDLIKRIRDSS